MAIAGVTDHLAESEPHAISIARNILSNLNLAAAAAQMSSHSILGAANPAFVQQGIQPQQPSGDMSHLPSGTWEEPVFPAEQLRGDFTILSCVVTHTTIMHGIGVVLPDVVPVVYDQNILLPGIEKQ